MEKSMVTQADRDTAFKLTNTYMCSDPLIFTGTLPHKIQWVLVLMSEDPASYEALLKVAGRSITADLVSKMNDRRTQIYGQYPRGTYPQLISSKVSEATIRSLFRKIKRVCSDNGVQDSRASEVQRVEFSEFAAFHPDMIEPEIWASLDEVGIKYEGDIEQVLRAIRDLEHSKWRRRRTLRLAFSKAGFRLDDGEIEGRKRRTTYKPSPRWFDENAAKNKPAIKSSDEVSIASHPVLDRLSPNSSWVLQMFDVYPESLEDLKSFRRATFTSRSAIIEANKRREACIREWGDRKPRGIKASRFTISQMRDFVPVLRSELADLLGRPSRKSAQQPQNAALLDLWGDL